MPKDNYEVGYGRPPKKHQFEPGKSGNPAGRKKGAKGLKSDLTEEMREMLEITENGKTIRVTKQRLMIKSMVQKAAKGDVRAQNAILEMVIRISGVEDEYEGKAKLSAQDQAVLDSFLSTSSSATEEDNGNTDNTDDQQRSDEDDS